MAKSNEPKKRRLHRVDVVLKQQGMSHRAFARMVGLTMTKAPRLRNPSENLLMSELRRIQAGLGDVPLADLLVKPDGKRADEDTGPTQRRAALVVLKKTAGSVLDELREDGDIKRAHEHARNFIKLLLEFAPQLEAHVDDDVAALMEEEFLDSDSEDDVDYEAAEDEIGNDETAAAFEAE